MLDDPNQKKSILKSLTLHILNLALTKYELTDELVLSSLIVSLQIMWLVFSPGTSLTVIENLKEDLFV